MLKIEISSKKPKPAPVSFPSFPYPPKTTTPIVIGEPSSFHKEIARRQEIIKSILKDCKIAVGDVCIASTESDREKYGDIVVLNIAQNYQELGKDYEWKTDNPLLVYAQSKNSSRFFCTVNFLEKKV